jgi:hypothetical protein
MSAYAKLPDEDPETPAERALAAASNRANKVAAKVGHGLRRAGRELEAPANADVAALINESNLPEIVEGDALASLAQRLDREADLWRNLAIRELAHVAWANRIAHLASSLAMVGVLVLAGIGAFESLFAPSNGRAALLGVSAAVLALGAGVATAASASVRRSQREVVRDALVRADLAELRLHRVAIAMAAVRAENAEARGAIARVERDAAS